MDFSSIPLFSAMKAKLNYASQRQALLAQNIANADTPNYRAKDMEKPDFAQAMASVQAQKLQQPGQGRLPMAVTDAQHITPNASPEHFKVIDRPTTDELNPNGNNVSIEEEMMKVAENQGEYQRTLSLYRKMISMFGTAIGHSNTNG